MSSPKQATRTAKKLTAILKPLHLHFEFELHDLAEHFTKKGKPDSLALIQDEIELRRQETEIAKNRSESFCLTGKK